MPPRRVTVSDRRYSVPIEPKVVSLYENSSTASAWLEPKSTVTWSNALAQAVRLMSAMIVHWSLTLWVTLRLAEAGRVTVRSEEHTSELQSRENLVCRLL